MGFVRGFLAILFGILLIPILSILLMIVSSGILYVEAWETAIFSMDFTTIANLIGAPINFDILTSEGLGIPLMNAFAVSGTGGFIEAIGATGDLSAFIADNIWKIIVFAGVGGFVGAIMSKATNGLLIALGIWVAWFAWNLLFAWMLLPMLFGSGVITIGVNILPFLMNSLIPLAILIVAGAIGGSITKSEEF